MCAEADDLKLSVIHKTTIGWFRHFTQKIGIETNSVARRRNVG